ncbi:MAG: hypothetical protein HYT49_03680 [Candidatus Wildermuthbacteria bacterium]|nr:hypothetical protein [Candidatus Wildermuthbacteria bacterium]
MAIFEELKSIGKVLQEAGKIEQYQQILGLQQQVLDMQKKIDDLETEKKELGSKLQLQNSLVYENNAYWIKQENKKDGPFCSRCWDVEKNAVRIKQGVNNPSFHTCPECETQVQTDPGFRPMFTSRKPPMSYL